MTHDQFTKFLDEIAALAHMAQEMAPSAALVLYALRGALQVQEEKALAQHVSQFVEASRARIEADMAKEPYV